MVSFQCDACQDVVKKPKLDNHRARCNASFTCIDCSTTFTGPHQYKAHTSCISEAQKYEKSLYKGAKGNANGGHQNGRQNGRGGGYHRPGRSYGPAGSGPNGQPLGDTVKMVYTPPNEGEEPTPSSTSPTRGASTSEAKATEPTAQAEGITYTGPEKKQKVKKPKKDREPPPPGETRAERKKRKKAERAMRKEEKLKLKAQQRAAKMEAIQAKKKEAPAIHARSNGPAEKATLPEGGTDLTIQTVDASSNKPQDEPSKSKKRKHLEQVNGDTDVRHVPQCAEEQSEKPEKKKKKKSKEKERAGTTEAAPMGVDVAIGEQEEVKEKKSKKRKRDAEDVGGKDMADEMAGLSFKERAKAEKKARKAVKKARLEAEAAKAS